MKLSLQSDQGVTMVENRFIDQYMPEANGEFVKVYLYLLRCALSGRDLSVSSIADVFDHTDKDILRALKYWEKTGLIRTEYADAKTPISLTFVMPDGQQPGAQQTGLPQAGFPQTASEQLVSQQTGSMPAASHEAETEETSESTAQSEDPQHAAAPELPHRIHPTAARRKELRSQNEFAQLVFVGESYLGRPMKSQEMNNLIYFYDNLHFSADLIEYLLEYCAEKGNPGPNYMSKVAEEWFKAGITTPEMAKAASHAYRQEYYAIFRCLGLSGRRPSDPEMAYMDKWLETYGYTVELIKEACKRTVLSAGKPDFRYLDGILTKWQALGIKTIEDISRLDTRPGEAKDQTGGTSSGAVSKSTRTSRKSSTQANRFNSFEQQRGYDWDDLTSKLISTPEGK